MSIMTPEVQWEVIILNMQKAKWSSQEDLNEAVSDMRAAWNQGEDRDLLMRAATNFGQVSGFNGKTMLTTAHVIAHEKTLLGKPAAPAMQAPIKIEDAEVPLQETHSVAWREAVAQRKAMLAAAKDEMTAQIKTLRDNYAELERNWDDYVAATREAARKSK